MEIMYIMIHVDAKGLKPKVNVGGRTKRLLKEPSLSIEPYYTVPCAALYIHCNLHTLKAREYRFIKHGRYQHKSRCRGDRRTDMYLAQNLGRKPSWRP